MPKPVAPIRAAVYTRISVTDASSASLAGQDAELRARAANEGWDIISAFEDDGVSGGKQRENAAEALAMLADGRIDLLGVYAYDRWSRQGVEFLADLLRALRLRRESGRPARFVAIREGVDGDGSEDGFDLRLSISADLARAERDRTAARMRQAVAYRRSVGKHTGGPAPLGYRAVDAPDGGKVLVIDPDEAAMVRDMADRLLRGVVGVSGLARELARANVPTPKSDARLDRIEGIDIDAADYAEPTEAERRQRGKRRADAKLAPYRGVWDATTVRRLLTSDRIAGRVTEKGKPVTGDDGLPVTFWEPVLDAGTLDLIRKHLAPASRPVAPRRADRLLSGVAYCASCDNRLWAGEVRNGVPVYRCPGRGCSRPAFMRAEALEAHVEDRYLAIAGDWPEVETIETADNTTAAAIADIEVAIDALMVDMRTARGGDRLQLMEKLDELDARADALRSVPIEVSTEVRFTGRTMGEAWEAADTIADRRHALTRALDHVTVAPNDAPTGRRVNYDRVAFYWHPSPDDHPTYA
ncbi:recombinase family protein [Microbacterium sp. RG1]|uniref:recombinase family protein n=1 Tax=Microbacterium sp. RG1 TaxID=2489212 RepID=UPI001375DA73|nr:recombinase family protein [Microbacterium sp. RG1]